MAGLDAAANRDDAIGPTLVNPAGASDIVLVCEHASRFIPPQFGDLGLTEAQRTSHIAWDPGALAVAEALSARFDAPLVRQTVSRLIYDCNRPPHAPDAIPVVSETHTIAGNKNLTAADRARRTALVYEPFRTALAALVKTYLKKARRPVLVTIHSFVPVFKGKRRAVEIGILHDSDARLADAMLMADAPFRVERNQPYGPDDGVTHTLKTHALPHGLFNVMLEIRSDLIADTAGIARVAAWLGDVIEAALCRLGQAEATHA